MAKYLDGPFAGEKIRGDNYMKIDGPYECNDSGRKVWGIYERTAGRKDRSWRSFWTESEASEYIKTSQKNLYSLD